MVKGGVGVDLREYLDGVISKFFVDGIGDLNQLVGVRSSDIDSQRDSFILINSLFLGLFAGEHRLETVH